ncbi:hypothetical protein SLEP1_g12111 [Rubroshorea leprosula]|nr:hypothetical protein SLEP1_g12111 [Rubroshorea leprosula]
MGFGALRTVVRSLSRTVLSRTSATCSATSFLSSTPFPTSNFRSAFAPAAHGQSPLIPVCSPFHSLTDTRYPKRRPQDKPRRKRTSLRPPGPYAWVQYVPGQPILPNNPNEGSVKRRKEKKRMRQHRAFVLVCIGLPCSLFECKLFAYAICLFGYLTKSTVINGLMCNHLLLFFIL